jgi:hypothetical protein
MNQTRYPLDILIVATGRKGTLCHTTRDGNYVVEFPNGEQVEFPSDEVEVMEDHPESLN